MTDSATTTYAVPEISCGHCKSTIERAVQGLGDGARVEVDINAKTVTVDGGDRDAILAAIETAGYDIYAANGFDVDEVSADPAVSDVSETIGASLQADVVNAT
jgi:copper chaperone